MLPESGSTTDNPSDFSSWFNNPEHADVLLHLSTLAEANGQQQQQHARSFHAHAIILQCSANFGSSLTNAWQQASKPRSIGDCKAATSAPTAASVRYELVELVEADELDAMEELLRLMYSQKVPVGTPIELLLQMLRLADRYQAVSCMQLLLMHLATAGKHAITLDVAAQLVSMPANVLADVQTCLAFKSLCSEVLVELYSHVSAVIQSDDLRQQFCKLPHVAVLAWAESERLRVQSENCVVYLLSAWVKAQQLQGGQGVSAAQLEQLAHQVRVLQLGPAYQEFVLPNLEWFKGCSGMAHWHTLMTYNGTTSTGQPVTVLPFPAVGWDCQPEWQWDGPVAWVAGPRQLLPAAPRSLKWDLGPEELQQLYEGGLDTPVLHTTHLYANGFQVRFQVEKKDKVPGQGATLEAHFHVSHQLMSRHGVPWPDTGSVSLRKLKCKVNAAAGVTAARCCGFNTRSAAGHKGWALGNVLDRSAPTLEELLAPLLVDGKLLLEMTVKGVDEAPRQRRHDSCDDSNADDNS